MSRTKPTLFLVHGFMGSALNWGPIITRLKANADLQSAGWEFKTADLLGHGGRLKSDLWQGSESGTRLTLDLVTQDLLKHQVPKTPFIALGHSFGLRPLLKMQSKAGHQMRALIAEDASPEITQAAYDRLKNILAKVQVPFKTRDEAKASIEAAFADDLRLAAFLFSNIRSNAIGVQDWRFDSRGLKQLLEESRGQSLWDEWLSFQGPAHVMRGENSDHLSAERAQEMIDRRGVDKNTALIQIAQSGHWIHSDQADLFTEALVKILRSCQSLF